MQEHFLVRKLVLIHLKALKISILRGIFRVFLARQNFSLSEYLEGYPRQMLLGMRCSQASQVSSNSWHLSTELQWKCFPIYGCQFQMYWFNVQNFLKGGEVKGSIQFSSTQRASLLGRFCWSWKKVGLRGQYQKRRLERSKFFLPLLLLLILHR